MTDRRLACTLGVFAAAAASFAATTVRELIPTSAPHGARVVIAGRGLDSANVQVSFTDSAGRAVAAPVISSTATALELAVPLTAASGAVQVTSSGAAIGTFTFTLAPDPTYVRVATLAVSSEGHDLLKAPSGVAIGINGTMFVADTGHNQIRTIAADGTVSVFAGSGRSGNADGAAASASFKDPSGLAFDAGRKILYVADSGNDAIRKITAEGVVSTIPNTDLKKPSGLAVDLSGNLFIADTGNHRIRKITPAGVVIHTRGRHARRIR